ncbi:MAG: hypothetical protein R2851_20800 [Caldilineaceae bacterium]
MTITPARSDVGLYYAEAHPLPWTSIRAIADRVSAAEPPPSPTSTHGAHGSTAAWIRTAHGKVDFLYRNLDQVHKPSTTHNKASSTTITASSPPSASTCHLPGRDQHLRAALRSDRGHCRLEGAGGDSASAAAQGNGRRRLALVGRVYAALRDYAAKGDVYNTVGCLTRAATNLTQALFALNERYFIRDKQVMGTIAGFALRPADYGAA